MIERDQILRSIIEGKKLKGSLPQRVECEGDDPLVGIARLIQKTMARLGKKRISGHTKVEVPWANLLNG